MAKRSPILGYNHNVRHRGVVFHVQTEDSGVDNPHLFTHLFHGGTILSTRKLDYDRDSVEEVVKSLMQSQHKAILKELKSGVFDEKINRYLGDNPDLLPAAGAAGVAAEPAAPRASEAASAATEEVPTLIDTAATQQVPVVADTRTTQDSALAAAAAIAALDGAPQVIEDEDSDATIRIEIPPGHARPGTEPEEGQVPAPARPTAARAATANRTVGFGSAMFGAAGPRAATPPPVPAREPAADLAAPTLRNPGAPLPARPPPGSVEFRKPTSDRPPTADHPPPRAWPGAASASAVEFRKPHKATESELSAAFSAIRTDELATPPAATPSAPSTPTTPSPRPATVPPPTAIREPEVPSLYIHTRSGRHSAAPEEVSDDPTARQDVMSGRTRSAPVTAVRSAAPAAAPGGKRAQPSRQDVVISKPSVIVGAPPRVVGAPGRAPEGKAPRRAREDVRPGLFGKDLISEKSLDEVILAYLSEDGEDK